MRAVGVLRSRVGGHGQRAVARGCRGGRPARSGLLRRAGPAHRPGAPGRPAGPAHRPGLLRGRRRRDRHRRRGLRFGDEGVRRVAGRRPEVVAPGRRAWRPGARRDGAARVAGRAAGAPPSARADGGLPRRVPSLARPGCAGAAPRRCCGRCRACGSYPQWTPTSAAVRPASTTCWSPSRRPNWARGRRPPCGPPGPTSSSPANPGCLLQIAAAMRADGGRVIPTLHTIELLDASLRGVTRSDDECGPAVAGQPRAAGSPGRVCSARNRSSSAPSSSAVGSGPVWLGQQVGALLPADERVVLLLQRPHDRRGLLGLRRSAGRSRPGRPRRPPAARRSAAAARSPATPR